MSGDLDYRLFREFLEWKTSTRCASGSSGATSAAPGDVHVPTSSVNVEETVTTIDSVSKEELVKENAATDSTQLAKQQPSEQELPRAAKDASSIVCVVTAEEYLSTRKKTSKATTAQKDFRVSGISILSGSDNDL